MYFFLFWVYLSKQTCGTDTGSAANPKKPISVSTDLECLRKAKYLIGGEQLWSIFSSREAEALFQQNKGKQLAKCYLPNGALRGQVLPHYMQKKINWVEIFNGKVV